MPSPSSSSSGIETPASERILVLTSSPARDREILNVVTATQVGVESFTSLDALVDALDRGAGAILIDEDAITERASRLLSSAMVHREPWSNLPIIVLTAGTPEAIERLDALDLFGPATSSNVTILERPVHEVTVKTVVRSALRARRRQYEVRDLMKNLQAMNEQLRRSQAALQEANESLERRVEARTQQVRKLALALTSAEQRERARISEILHDHLQQLLHGARIWAESLAKDPEEAPVESGDRILGLLNEALETTRSLTMELSPPVLQENGFVAALEWLSSHVQEMHGLDLTVDVPTDVDIREQDLRTLVFRSIRELVFNVIKHAEVDRATLRVDQTPEGFRIYVSDEGVGFDPAKLQEEETGNDHFGLSSVRRRLDLVGGDVAVTSAPGEGTTVRIDVPLSNE